MTDGNKLAEIREIYFKTTRATILKDFDRAIDILKSMESEKERERATVYMQGLAEMRKEFGKSGKIAALYLSDLTITLRAASRSTSGTFRSIESIFVSRSFRRCRYCIDSARGVFGFFASASITP